MPDYTGGEYLLEWTSRMRFRAAPAPGFIVPLSQMEIMAFFSLREIVPMPWEVDAVTSISAAFVRGWGLGLEETSYSPMELDRMERENVRS